MKQTIAAISTALNPSGIGIVRVTGPETMDVLYRVYRSKTGKKDIRKAATHTIHYGYIYDGEECIDEVLVMWMQGPRTYTGEDTAEINCHGGVLAVQKVLEAVLKAGARPAEPGEFTKKAFLNGKMDLSQAEAVMDVIGSDSQYALQNSLQQLKGSLHDKITGMRETILYHIAYIESALDDPEHISIDGYGEELEKALRPIEKEVRRLIRSYGNGRLMKDGIRTVILGKPNAGKSSILNLMMGEDRAIVTDIAGTTRDVLEEQIMLGKVALRLADTAGIRDTEDIVERIGVDRAREYAAKADLVLFVVDASTPFGPEDEDILYSIRDKKYVVLLNKTDLEEKTTKEELEKKTDHPVLLFSAAEEKGLEELEQLLEEMFFSGVFSFEENVTITNSRHKAELEETLQSLSLVFQSIADQMPEDFYSIDLMNAYEHLGNIIGESVGEDLVNEIFSKFCTGK